MPAAPAPLLYADTQSCADQLYFGRVEVPDPFVAFGVRGRKICVQSALEYGRVRRTGDFDTVLARETWLEKARARHGAHAGVAEMIACLAREYGVQRFRVPDDFPASLWVRLRRLGVRLELAGGLLFPEREIKSPREAAAIRAGNRLCTVGFRLVEDVLRKARPRGRTLRFAGRILTSEHLRFLVETAIREQGGDPRDTIIAGGDQACDPHERGTGPLRPHELIVVDIFPRVRKTGYYGDMTRTYLKGRASEAQRRLVATVRAAQKAGIRMVRAGVDGRDVHELVQYVFTQAGYPTTRGRRGATGFIHGTGHGLGLAVHDPGRLGPVSSRLKPGAVLTVEPGLYYPGLGGCRWEDVVQVTDGPARLLSRHPYAWEIR